MDDSFTSGSFGEIVVGFSKFHDYQQVAYKGSGSSKLYTVISGERKLFLKAANSGTATSAENIARLQREYKLLERLYGNEHIVRCIGWREDAEVGPCIVMEYIDGVTLAEFLASSPSYKERKRVLNELLDALAFIHNHQVVHNDLKLENILITRNGHNVKLIDFGYADSDANLDKATGGTKAFASPELLNQQATDGTSDIYSLGFIIKALFPHCYKRIVRKCQQKDSRKRYLHVSEVGRALRRHSVAKWMTLVAACVLAAVLVWSNTLQNPSAIPEVFTQPVTHDTVFVVHEHYDTVVMDATPTPTPVQTQTQPQSQPVKQETIRTVTIINGHTDALNLDSIHQAYQDLYHRFEIQIKEVKYQEFASLYRMDFGYDLEELMLAMRPKDEALQSTFDNDYITEYNKYISKSSTYITSLPRFRAVVDDDSLKASLEEEYEAKWSEFGKRQQHLEELRRKNL